MARVAIYGGTAVLVVAVVFSALVGVPTAAVVGSLTDTNVRSATPQYKYCVVVVADDEAEDRSTTAMAVMNALKERGCEQVSVLTPLDWQSVIASALSGKNGTQADIVVLDWDYYEGPGDTYGAWTFRDNVGRFGVTGPWLADQIRKAGYLGPIRIITRGGTERLSEKVPDHVGQAFAKPDFWANPLRFIGDLIK